MGRGNVPGRAASALWPSLVKLHFVHRPYGPFHVFDSHETFVERQVVSHCVLYKIIHRLNKQRKKRTKPTQSRPPVVGGGKRRYKDHGRFMADHGARMRV